jgi:tetratricopeptide (TPR) repeat protein
MEPPAQSGSRRRWAPLLAAVCLFGLLAAVGLGSWAGWRWWRSSEPPLPPEGDPRQTFATPYRNVRPGVAYVGDTACAGCHAEKAETYHQHPMGRSMAPTAAIAALERYDQDAHNPFEALGLRFRVERRGQQVFHKEQVPGPQGRALAELEAEVRFVIGSGTRGRSYLVERDGYLFQSPISWYSQKDVWDLSPAFDAATHFNRPVLPECLFCHANHVVPVEHTRNRYEGLILLDATIGCERCHGPGELHAREREAGADVTGLDTSIVNPRRLEPALRESVCQQCHLQGDTRILRRGRQTFDFRPALPLQLFWSVFVRPAELTDNYKAVSEVEQMNASRCFRDSKRELGCISCHDPHVLPAADQRVSYYRGRCLQCHQEAACSLSAAQRREQRPDDSCIACHMPPLASSTAAHTALTDHRILRRAERGADRPAPRPGLRIGEMPLVSFYHDQRDPNDPSVGRDKGLALIETARLPNPDEARAHLGRAALPLLRAAVKDWPGDIPAREGEAYALWLHGRQQEALDAYEGVLARAPQREQALADAGTLAEMLHRPQAAIAYWRRAVAVNPWDPDYHASLARLLAESQEWPAAITECEALLRLEPNNVPTRRTLITCCLRSGDEERARRELDSLLALQPENAGELRRWFAEQPRRR